MPKNNAPNTGNPPNSTMNDMRTLTTTTALARAMRRAGCVLLLALGACSCTTDADLLPAQPGPSGITDPRTPIRISVAPRPAYREVNLDGTPANTNPPPATRVEQTETGSRWEDDDVIWLRAEYTYGSASTAGPTISALIYDKGAWRSFNDEEYNKYVPSNPGVASSFERELRWPEEVLKDTDGKCTLKAAYAGNDVPKGNSIYLSEPHKVDYMTAGITFGPEETAKLQFGKKYMRIYVTKAFSGDLPLNTYTLFSILDHYWDEASIISLPNSSPGYYFAYRLKSYTFTVNGIPVTLQPDANGSYIGLSYTIDPDKLKNGPIAPEPTHITP